MSGPDRNRRAPRREGRAASPSPWEAPAVRFQAEMLREAFEATAGATECRACGRLIPESVPRALSVWRPEPGKLAMVPICLSCCDRPDWEAVAEAACKPSDVFDASLCIEAMNAARRDEAARKKTPPGHRRDRGAGRAPGRKPQ